MIGRMSLVKVAGFWASTRVVVATATARKTAGISLTDVWNARITTSPRSPSRETVHGEFFKEFFE